MSVPVMDVRIMRMRVDQRFMPVWMRMRLARWIARGVGMPVMLVVRVEVVVLRRLVLVFVFVPLGEVQHHASAHEYRRNAKSQGQAVPQEQNRKGCAHKRRDGKVSACPGRAQVAQRQDKQR